ncbi:phage associated protein [Neisseria gonorrhoeae]|uniref:Phage associated protein n=1 Tax=Neisseria gonorrhoeae TaxID=485 RepID=A0A378VVG7_NEIGO|nr:phage associated protein [Neisseria gonorrhoeae]
MKYWLVGASWGGQGHQDQFFVENGYWVLEWESSQQPDQFAKGEKSK